MSAGRVALVLVGLAMCLALYALLRPMVDRASCSDAVVEGSALLGFVQLKSEAKSRADAASRGLTTTGSWTDWQSRYDILSDPMAKSILDDPSTHLAAARQVIEGGGFDDTQKMIAVLLMQRLPVGKYVCFMDSVNRAIEAGVLKDKRIAVQALLPDVALRSSTVNYWWHPIWRTAFQKNAMSVLEKGQVERVLGGVFWLRSL